MWCILMVLVGIVLSVSNANGWFIVPDFCIYICFAIAAGLFVLSLINFFVVGRRTKKMHDDFQKRFNRW